ncbi:hypothetical protein A2422_01060 [Candidatus Woesebacteria bacterium RIFOXYC1_FULL_31_51]|uniref:Uncharacterized protein n=1 Tax=Candidatus Woesebacteria bacterium GW2011_GWC2_31_9 TaxID=1618586 RepID=A0A0G0AY46_9BACT|nr:MAG: hypothetical protein UR17_C0001G0662 [Candidatus Woesebacteria bacterium GW2011_GWF1_31_35]KKP22725.1 MAG: hypothetical protein UR11_C0002G0105 [Candidatus Woesebacteria bacterium GW2011_GWC1_30_29]KKP25892.1 MAG: hypothetical protein UR13_C0006G0031 [Candidatus Woesebacteria bacterium GW2011_GWD1_31_12]KKP27119.1 MAG: hypothetical protein UR16_C0006G0008 [Candidatus Woesebacteria bacterium GW2011_GWB1_31_29]KKP31485.1 MAG: hypothetical protein UR21_C0009G0066 [Candidatus Woesebacteria 
MKKGFTLVELLIVIGLLGAIALIVISAINPIEQANRARDTRFKADGGQLISAIDRYFVGASAFPWMTVDPAIETDDAYPFITASTQGVGLCGATCAADGLLITTNELKTEFRNRDFLDTGTTVSEQIMVGKALGSSTSVYACFVPLSKSVREKACADGKVYTLATSVRTAIAANDASCAADSATWISGPQYVCMPE